MAHCFVGLPLDDDGKAIKTYLRSASGKKVRQVLWGDWLNVDGEEPDGRLRIIWAPKGPKPQTLYIPKAHTTDTRPLEIVFLDVGQGDGAVLISPERGSREAVMVIDAGESEKMYDFLKQRFRSYKENFRFHAAILTHSDSDHYGGFEYIFASPSYGFDHVYHNGLLERPEPDSWKKLGRSVDDPQLGRTVQCDLVETTADIERLFGPDADIGSFRLPKVMRRALENPHISDFSMLSSKHGVEEDGRVWLPGFAPSDNRGYAIEILAPVPETASDGTLCLRRLGSSGETKNGHSVVLRLHFKSFKILFGGDLNEKAEKYLLTHYTGRTQMPKSGTPAYDKMIEEARHWFEADLMKVCHHGSEKVTDAFIEAVNPAAFVISSGDEEGHVHPRPDLLGRLGKLGRGASPVILSTELQRSVRETADVDLLRTLVNRIMSLHAKPSEVLRDKIIAEMEVLGQSNVTVYGTIYVKTDGERLMAAFRVETTSQTKKWFTFDYAFDAEGALQIIR
ncbi:MBL fold metallo-hydrolase [Pseudohoeflea suaedae]|uniref:MBL fold metallo-hydrolase n=1 Tax=Pseudohoeflea suaedae TaxID=877384 RepID=A0A4R5PNC6_9HYPH|nr:MBL fold metallo-hydrolase [Pseudohoeflea suaedae]TDH38047.1 MBL fold metallo-hydrolase [Pseudohoeflea suaedae]